MRRISNAYDDQGRLSTVTQYDAAAIGSGSADVSDLLAIVSALGSTTADGEDLNRDGVVDSVGQSIYTQWTGASHELRVLTRGDGDTHPYIAATGRGGVRFNRH